MTGRPRKPKSCVCTSLATAMPTAYSATDGSLFTPPLSVSTDSFIYDQMNPVQTVGGGDCCNGGTVIPGAFYDVR